MDFNEQVCEWSGKAGKLDAIVNALTSDEMREMIKMGLQANELRRLILRMASVGE